MAGNIQANTMDEKEWNKIDGVCDIGDNAGDTGDGVGGSKDRVKVEDDDEAMGVETVDKKKRTLMMRPWASSPLRRKT